ncbi:AAA family ATPase [Bacillus sp. ISL-51]|uniref:ATP-dependent nuclease n=1 Tax=Bacteria TaxID=2 RepID=UPI001BEBC461|nr:MULTISPECIES: AAA family ATPase [Bacteria]MBT2574976.1 AAA family ATPase [Bacillus sp. ISL-51]MBT2634219.1 AAA family ATPase [Bacillus sp. ISL-26]MBT2713785.1 AAA family ATPase [Pseudomonas sp. ISL-88]
MIKKITVNQYRKIKDLDFDFVNGINIISGSNGTCKTSLLHMISNSFQAVNKRCTWIQEPNCLDIFNKVNSSTNPKIESLTKGDKQYNDPANGHNGALFSVEYINHGQLSFRKHNSKINGRYAVKPYYSKDTKDSLPFCPVVYLSLARLFPFGEFRNEDAVEDIKKNLPDGYQIEIANLYTSFTHINISSSAPQKMGDIKVRTDFISDIAGVDSNTISAGEDNLYMLLTALVSLKYYYQSIQSNNDIESILLIDEFDATLHPSYQFKLLELIREFSTEYKIQVAFTTHSLPLLEYALKRKDNVIYLIDNMTNVIKMETPDIYKIKMFLHNETRDDIYTSNVIPVFTEDSEARIFLNILLDYFETNFDNFTKVRRFFHLVEANIGAINLINIFSDTYLLKSTMQSICILDGDQKDKRCLDKYIIVLPGQESPEKLIMEYALQLLDNDDSFWTSETILNLNYGKTNFLSNRKPDIEGINQKLKTLRDSGESTHGVERDMRKKVFLKHQRFFEILFKHWVNNPEHEEQIKKFYEDLHIMFRKVSEFHGINPKEWDFE